MKKCIFLSTGIEHNLKKKKGEKKVISVTRLRYKVGSTVNNI